MTWSAPRGMFTSFPRSSLSISFSQQDWLQWSLLLLSLTCETRAFYVPGVAPMNFHQNDPVEIKVSVSLDCRSLCAGRSSWRTLVSWPNRSCGCREQRAAQLAWGLGQRGLSACCTGWKSVPQEPGISAE